MANSKSHFETFKGRNRMSMNFSGSIYDRIVELEKKIAELEDKLNDRNLDQLGPYNDSNKCKVCGISFGDGVYGYVCTDVRCPSRISCFTS